MRTLVHIPVIHAPVDLGCRSTPEYDLAHARFWDGVREYVSGKAIDRVYSDSLFGPRLLALHTVREMAEEGSRHAAAICELVRAGSLLMGTESRLAFYAPGLSRDPLLRRDRYIARRIDRTLREDETGILFMGAAHKAHTLMPGTIHVESHCAGLEELREASRLFREQRRKSGSE